VNKKKVFHLFNAFEVGGAERQHMEHVRRLVDSFQQVCWAPCGGHLEKELDELDIPHKAGGPETALALLEKEDFDCVVMRTTWFFDVLEPVLLKRFAPVIFIKDYLRWYQGNDRYLDPDYDSRALAVADQMLFISPSLRAGMHALDPKEKGGAILHNGIDLDTAPMKPRKPPADCLRIGMLANIVPHKNQLGAVTALRERLARPDFRLLIGGAIQDEDYGRQVNAAARGLNIELCGYVSDPIAFLDEVDVLLTASTREGWPVAPMEAMACGVPVVAPSVGDIPELLDHGRAGLIYDIVNIDDLPRMMDTLRLPDQYARYASAAIRRVSHFDIKQTSRQLKEVISRTIEA
jgi:glycosyltransferase involved in cell wall biosynthesis